MAVPFLGFEITRKDSTGSLVFKIPYRKKAHGGKGAMLKGTN